MMTPEAIQAHFDIKDHIESVAKLIKHKLFGAKGYLLGSGFLFEHHEDGRTLSLSVYGLGGGAVEDISAPARVLYDTGALDAFCADYEPKAARERREKFEELRKEFCEQPCVDH